MNSSVVPASGHPLRRYPSYVIIAAVGMAAAACGTSMSPARLQTSCASIAGQRLDASEIALPTRGVVIASAELVPAAPAKVSSSGATHALPDYCKVLGDILPVDAAAPAIKFQVNVPTDWNGKSIQVGGGGLNGTIPPNLAVVASSGSPISAAFPPDAPYPLSRGYAMFGGDSGHQETGIAATWALNDEAWVNFGHAALKKTHDAAFAVVRRLHGARPSVSYFMGQSQGGREAMEVAQRYPEDYDGVVATSPLVGYASHAIHKSMLAIPQAGPGWIPTDKLKTISDEVLRQCDGLDGLGDGVIGNYLACNALFDPRKVAEPFRRIRCPQGADTGPDCLSDAQIATIHRMHAPLDYGFDLVNGITAAPGYPAGREALPGWLNVTPRPGLPAMPNLGQPGATVQYGILKDPGFNLLNFDVATFKDRIQAAARVIDSTNPDLSRFFARGGRLIVKSQSTDYSSNPNAVMRYYDAVVARFGQRKVDEHVRFYVLPFGSHGGDVVSATTGAALPQYVDLVTMMTDWVEKGAAPPDAAVVSAKDRLPPYAVTATHPMCRYPLFPKYKGSGDAKVADSFVCAAN